MTRASVFMVLAPVAVVAPLTAEVVLPPQEMAVERTESVQSPPLPLEGPLTRSGVDELAWDPDSLQRPERVQGVAIGYPVLEFHRLWTDTDGDGIHDDDDSDDDGDGLSDSHEKTLGTDSKRRDTDGDGYTDYQEVYDKRLTNPPADYRTSGAKGCDPLRRDIFIELDYIGSKSWLFIDYCGHDPGSEPLHDMIDRFEEHGFNVLSARTTRSRTS